MPANCDGANPFMLAGYSVGDTLADAAMPQTTMAAPDLADITGNQYIICLEQDLRRNGNHRQFDGDQEDTGGDGTFNFTGSEGIDPFPLLPRAEQNPLQSVTLRRDHTRSPKQFGSRLVND